MQSKCRDLHSKWLHCETKILNCYFHIHTLHGWSTLVAFKRKRKFDGMTDISAGEVELAMN